MPINVDLVQLQCFQVLAKTQHMTKAANILNMAQSALSRSLKNLERELGVQVFDRVGKYIYLNENGQILLRHVDVMLREYEEAKSSLGDRRDQEKKTVVLSMYAGSKLLPELIRGFKSQYPDISLQIIQQGSAGERLAPSDITIFSVGQPTREENATVLMEEKIFLAMPADHSLAARKSVRLAEVAAEPFICLYKGKGLRVITDELCAQAGFEPNIVLESDSPATVRDLISLGVGLSFVPQISWQGMDEDKSVSLVEISEPKCSRSIVMTWRSDRCLTKAASKLREYLVTFFAEKEKKAAVQNVHNEH